MSERESADHRGIVWQREPSGLSFVHAGARVTASVVDEAVVHVVHAPARGYDPQPSLMVLEGAPRAAKWSVAEDERSVTLSTPELRLTIARDTGALAWFDASGRPLVREPRRGGRSLQPFRTAESAPAGAPPERVGGADSIAPAALLTTRLDLEFSPGEALYGLGQHEEGILDYRGRSQHLYQHNLKVAMPVLVSTRGYGIFWDTTAFASFHDDEHGSYFWTEAVRAVDFYFIVGGFDAIVAGIRRLTGRPPMLPRWAYGYIQSKERYKTQAELVAVVREHRRRGIPLDCIVQDWQSWTGDQWGDKTPDPARFPDPSALVRELHAEGAKLMVSIWPTLHGGGRDEVELRAGGFLLANDSTYDAFNPAARRLYWQQAERGWFRHGVDGWWCDCSEPFEPDWDWTASLKPEPWQRAMLNTAEPKRYLDSERQNAYSLVHARGIYEHQRAATSDKRVVNLTRSALPGQQRYGTVTWSGDITATWETLARQVPAGLGFTVTGNPRWTLDVGGFFVDRKKPWFWRGDFPQGVADPGYRELYVRWLELATFLPMMRAHGTDTPREPWRFGEPGDPFYEAVVGSIRLRYRLLPYLYALAAAEVRSDYTMLRLLAFDFLHDPAVYGIKDEFMLGPALLVCPVTGPMYFEPGSRPLEDVQKTRDVYLPGGTDWYDFWTGTRHAGGQSIVADAPLERIPLFVRAGALLPLGPAVQHSGEGRGEPLELRVYPGAGGGFELYDDEGDGYGYEAGAFCVSRLAWDDVGRELSIGERRGGYPGMPERRRFDVSLVGSGRGAGAAPSTEIDARIDCGSESVTKRLEP